MRYLGFIVFALLLLSSPAFAWSGTFDGVDPYSAFDVVGGVGWTTGSPSWDNTSYSVTSGSSNYLVKHFSTKQNYWELYFKQANNYVEPDYFIFRGGDRGYTNPNYCVVGFSFDTVTLSGGGTCAGIPAFSPAVTLSGDAWFRLTIEDLGTSLSVNIYNVSNGSLAVTRTLIDIANDDFNNSVGIETTSNVPTTIFDNILVSSVAPTTSNSISWDKDSYYMGDTATVSWVFAESGFWDWTYMKSVTVHRSTASGTDIVDTFITGPPQVGQVAVYPFEPGNYLARIGYRSYFGLGDFVLLANSSVGVYTAPGAYIFAPDSAYVNSVVNVSWGFDTAVSSGRLILKYVSYGDIAGVTMREYSVSGLSGITSVTFPKSGFYTLQLYNKDKQNLAASRDIQIFESGILPPGTVLANSLILDASIYAPVDSVAYTYSVNSTNWGAYGYFEVIVRNSAGTILGRSVADQQVGQGILYINELASSGAATVNLSAYSSAGSLTEVVLVSNPITISSTAGYGLIVFPRLVCGNGLVTSKWNVSYPSILRVSHINLKNVPVTEYFNLSVGAGSKSFVFNATDGSLINFDLLDINSSLKLSVGVQYRRDGRGCGALSPNATGTPPPSSDKLFATDEVPGDFAHDYKEWVYVKVGKSTASLFFVGLVHIVLFMAICLIVTKGKFPPIAGAGALLGLWFNVEIGFMDKAVAVAIVVLVGMALVGSMKKG